MASSLKSMKVRGPHQDCHRSGEGVTRQFTAGVFRISVDSTVDDPASADDYERTFIGTSDHDVVSAISATVMKLTGQLARNPFRIKDKTEALFLPAHFVGDI